MAPTQRQAIQSFEAGIGRFHEPQGSSSPAKNGEATMFDNKIDWVTRLEQGQARREACEPKLGSERVKYKAEHMQKS
jgi:hypothetical protein